MEVIRGVGQGWRRSWEWRGLCWDDEVMVNKKHKKRFWIWGTDGNGSRSRRTQMQEGLKTGRNEKRDNLICIFSGLQRKKVKGLVLYESYKRNTVRNEGEMHEDKREEHYWSTAETLERCLDWLSLGLNKINRIPRELFYLLIWRKF